jgi:hypothetical protein
MAFSREVRCPSCARPVSLRLAWEMTPKDRSGFLAYATGVVCPHCNARLRIVQRLASLVAVGFGVTAVLLAALVGPRNGAMLNSVGLAAAAVAIGLAFLPGIYAQRLLSLKIRTGTDVVDFPVERLKEDLATVTAGQDAPSQSQLTDAAAYWVCSKCGEPNPNSSGLCFTCGNYSTNAI